MPSVTSAKYNLKELQVATENQLESFQDVLLGVERDRRTFSTTATAIKVVHTAVHGCICAGCVALEANAVVMQKLLCKALS